MIETNGANWEVKRRGAQEVMVGAEVAAEEHIVCREEWLSGGGEEVLITLGREKNNCLLHMR